MAEMRAQSRPAAADAARAASLVARHSTLPTPVTLALPGREVAAIAADRTRIAWLEPRHVSFNALLSGSIYLRDLRTRRTVRYPGRAHDHEGSITTTAMVLGGSRALWQFILEGNTFKAGSLYTAAPGDKAPRLLRHFEYSKHDDYPVPLPLIAADGDVIVYTDGAHSPRTLRRLIGGRPIQIALLSADATSLAISGSTIAVELTKRRYDDEQRYSETRFVELRRLDGGLLKRRQMPLDRRLIGFSGDSLVFARAGRLCCTAIEFRSARTGALHATIPTPSYFDKVAVEGLSGVFIGPSGIVAFDARTKKLELIARGSCGFPSRVSLEQRRVIWLEQAPDSGCRPRIRSVPLPR